jgi:YD repeat-containing protein
MQRLLSNVALTIVFVALVLPSSYAQQAVTDQIKRSLPNPVPPSPNVASLGKFLDYPVGHYTGVPEVTIPLYEVKSGTLTVPITLSYHAAGVKPTDVGSWVGMGWSISAGGQLSRNVRGKPDEDGYYSTPLLPNSITTPPAICTDYQYFYNAATSVSDTEPDVYAYSFPGKGGQFILPAPPQGSSINPPAYLVPYAPYKVNKVNNSKYEITDDAGVLYRYGTGADGIIATEGTTATTAGSYTLVATTAWQLRDIIAPNSNDVIKFNYQANGSSYTKDVSYVFSLVDKCIVTNPNPDGVQPPPQYCPLQTNITEAKNVESNTTNTALSEIIFETGKVVFFLGSQRSDANQAGGTGIGSTLDHIIIYSKRQGTYYPEKQINFNYSYYTSASSSTESLRLDGVQFMTSPNGPPAQAAVQRYKFSYYGNGGFDWDRDEPTFFAARDYWGYYNGALDNTNLIKPRTESVTDGVGTNSTNTFGGATNREANLTFTKQGVLQKIDYPTGGTIEFDYELNQYDDAGTAKAAGGLRVNKMTTTDGFGSPPVIKTYKYGQIISGSHTGLGKANFDPSQTNSFGTTTIYGGNCVVSQAYYNYRSRVYYSMSAFGLDGFDNSSVRYNYVTEYFGDPAVQTNGRIDYVYDDGASLGDVNQTIFETGRSIKSTNSWRRGKLTSKSVYNAAGQLVSTNTIHYTRYSENTMLVGWGTGIAVSGTEACDPQHCTLPSGTVVSQNSVRFLHWDQSTGVLVDDQIQNTEYEAANNLKFVTTQTDKVNDATKLVPLTETFLRSTDNEARVTTYTYPFQLSTNGSSTNAAKGIHLLKNKNISVVPLEILVNFQNINGTNKRFISSQATTYKENPTNTNYVVPDALYIFESQQPVTTYSAISVNGTNNGLTMNSNLKLRLAFDKYDNEGNLLSYTKVGDIATTYRYGYSNAMPITQVANAGDAEVFTQNFEDNSGNSGSAVPHSGDLFYAGPTFPVSFTLPAGTTRSFVIDYWYIDGLGKWKYNIKAYTGATTLNDGSGYDDIRIYPKDAQISTFTYNTVNGKTSESDTNGLTTYFDYDKFGRLEVIRDSDKNVLKTYGYQYTTKLD